MHPHGYCWLPTLRDLESAKGHTSGQSTRTFPGIINLGEKVLPTEWGRVSKDIKRSEENISMACLPLLVLLDKRIIIINSYHHPSSFSFSPGWTERHWLFGSLPVLHFHTMNAESPSLMDLAAARFPNSQYDVNGHCWTTKPRLCKPF